MADDTKKTSGETNGATIVDLSLARHRLKLKQGLHKEYQDQADLDTEPLAYVEAVVCSLTGSPSDFNRDY